MSGDEIAKIIMALGTLITALLTGVSLVITARNSRKIETVTAKVDEVHKLTNSLSDRAQANAREAGRAEGELAGRAAKTAEQGADALARERAVPPKPTPTA